MNTVKSWLRPARRAALWPAVSGHRYWCPVCERGARRFLAAGTPRRPGARCPWCGTVERHRMLASYLDSLPAPKAVLHIAPERMIAQRLRPRAGRYVSLDLSAAADVHADLSQPLPFAEGEFDLIVCSHVLEHIPDDRAAMRNLGAVLAADGRLVVLVPVDEAASTREDPIDDPKERLRQYGQADHVRMYGPDVIDRLRESGLRVRQLGWREVPASDLARMRIDEAAGDIYECTHS